MFNSLPILERLQEFAKQGVIRQLDYQFATFVASRVEQNQASLAALMGALASFELGRGHVCVLLNELDPERLFGLPARVSSTLTSELSAPEHWLQELECMPVVSTGGQATPLVLEGGRLYLHRYWNFEQLVASKLKQAASSIEPAAIMSQVLDELFARSYTFLFDALKQAEKKQPLTQQDRQQLVCDMLDVVAPERLDWGSIEQVLTTATRVADLAVLNQLIPNSACLNWQKVAAAVALTRRFSVISGGPGTGKTTTVTKLLAALVIQAQEQQQVPTIQLVAPTGKAAARLTESIGQAVNSLAVDPEIKALIPTQSSTIHRLLGSIPNQVDFRHNRENPLHLDILVVDEASMVDLPMMARLLDAMPNHARLVLLGDRDQLASVEAGAVLGDICSFADHGYSETQATQLSKLTGYQLSHQNLLSLPSAVADSLCILRKSYRFDARSGIGQLAKAVNAGNRYQVEQVWGKGFSDIRFHEFSSDHYQSMIRMMVNGYRSYLGHISANDEPKVVLNAFSKVRLLCALREGDFGVSGLNQRIERALIRDNLISPNEELWYVGRPIMITRNDHGLELYNGDIGIAMRDPIEQRLRVYFDMPDGSIRGVLPSRLPEHETAYAMTIHKSQGSEFEHTVMALPQDFSPLLTRELIYTGITRAKKQLDLFGTQPVVARSVQVKTERASGLGVLLS
nr:exodeoxyribonuclease V subunit alpha [Vibrio sp. Of7-15]